MATIKKPAKKMQMGGSTKYSLDKAIKDAGFGSKKLSPDMNDRAPNPKSKGRSSSKGNDIDSLLKKATKKKEESKETLMKKGGVVKAKNGKSFPDLNKDGKITKADILKGRGVIAKKGAALKKQAAVAIAMKKAGKTPKAQSGASFKNVTDMFGRTGGFDGGMRNQMAASILKKKKAAAAPTMKKGGKMKKCAYGCK